MNKKLLKTITGIAVAGAALGAAFAYVKKCKEVNDLGDILKFRFFIVFRSYCVVIFSTKTVPVLLPMSHYLTKVAIKSGNTLSG